MNCFSISLYRASRCRRLPGCVTMDSWIPTPSMGISRTWLKNLIETTLPCHNTVRAWLSRYFLDLFSRNPESTVLRRLGADANVQQTPTGPRTMRRPGLAGAPALVCGRYCCHWTVGGGMCHQQFEDAKALNDHIRAHHVRGAGTFVCQW